MRLPKNRQPTHPGEVLLKDFLEPMDISQVKFAKHLGWTYARLNEIVNGKRGVSADTALAFSEAFSMEADFWLNLQISYDLWLAAQKHKKVSPLVAA
jgi:addiction module HigA family antidote